MGMITVSTGGSFGNRYLQVGAMDHGHAHAVAQVIEYLSSEVLPWAIQHDHYLHDLGSLPKKNFNSPKE